MTFIKAEAGIEFLVRMTPDRPRSTGGSLDPIGTGEQAGPRNWLDSIGASPLPAVGTIFSTNGLSA
ncbi:MAG: hypothetical protein KDJ41_20250 [Hyphomicrobiaceae bacterium]|nr:hypothetical protein [Hyphomicrobiaceae bacterium]